MPRASGSQLPVDDSGYGFDNIGDELSLSPALLDHLSMADIGVPLDEPDRRGRTPIQIGDVIPLDQPIQRMADIIISRGGTPRYFPKEYVKPAATGLK